MRRCAVRGTCRTIERGGADRPTGRYDRRVSAAAWVEPVVLEGRIVRLEPLTLAHLGPLAEIAFDPSIWRWTTARPTDVDGLRDWLEAAVSATAAGAELAFATIERATGRAIGSTRFLSIVPEHRRLEIGWTWLAPPWQRSGANREAKLLQLEHAFEHLGANRVEFKTDSRNEASRAALLGIGATFEGIFRNHVVMPDGPLRHSAWYSIVAEEWPSVRAGLEARLRR
jgi:RimJ/RimL family protein N-acetyltransferase